MKKIISLLLTLLILIPAAAFPVSADFSDWVTLGAKYSAASKNIIAPKSNNCQIKTDGFEFTETDGGKISVVTPDHTAFNGAYGVSALCSKKMLPLDGLSITIEPDEFDFATDENGAANQISVLWTDKPVTEIAGGLTDNEYTTGLYNSDRVIAGGLRNIVSPDTRGLCITITAVSGSEEDPKIADTLRIFYYDGGYTDEYGNVGYDWTFTKKHSGDIMPLDLDASGYIPYKEIDLTYGAVINIRADEELGYIVNVNGEDFYGEYAAYSPEGMTEIDLSELKKIGNGYITAGAASVKDQYMSDHNCSYTLSYINTYTPCEVWDNLPIPEPVPHDHTFTVEKAEPDCTEDGYIRYICECGYEYTDTLPALGHSFGEWVKVDEATKVKSCSVCGEWVESLVFEPDPLHLFTDVKENAWYTDSVRYVLKNNYMNGMSTDTFSPNTGLTREQFVTILANIAGVDTDEYNDMNLMTDVPSTRWYAGEVNWAVSEGYVAGVAEGVFGAGQPIQRAALARLLYLYAEKNGKETDTLEDLSGYTDFEKVEDWMAEGLGWAVKHGIITSTKDDSLTLDPKGIATRAQCARMLTVYDSVPDKETTPVPEPEPEPEPVTEPESEPVAEPMTEYTPLEIDTDDVKDWLVGLNTFGATGAYKYDGFDLKIFYSPEDDCLFALYGENILYNFSGDRVEILRYGNIRPLFEIWNDYELALPYMEVFATATLTKDGIDGGPAEYEHTLNRMYEELVDILSMIGAIE